jgi:hypothetical protein
MLPLPIILKEVTYERGRVKKEVKKVNTIDVPKTAEQVLLVGVGTGGRGRSWGNGE